MVAGQNRDGEINNLRIGNRFAPKLRQQFPVTVQDPDVEAGIYLYLCA